MIGRFRNDKEIFYGEVRGNRVIVDRGLYSDTFLLQDLSLLPPTIPTKIICVGLNYKDHAKELGMQVPDDPVIFLKPPSAVIGAYGNIVYPDASKNVDYEGELGVIINKRCKNVRASEAISVILGYTCFNDVTARDIQKKETQWTRSKSFDTFAPVGPYIVDPELDISDLAIRTRVNGELRQDSSTANLIFDVPYLIEFISGIMTLERGDIISTGTPPGVGELFIGDEVEVEIERVGSLKNSVVGHNQGMNNTLSL
ncbi:MAG: fumarylacetoacetate hydrolase family protein [Candidatus Methanoperedens sp.]|nr:fumarylacetoacetate hydrolase family protein [Candidatus Methanoperedens sp.]